MAIDTFAFFATSLIVGAKINGSGGGGCMFAYAPNDPARVLEAVRKISGEAYIIYSADGTREEIMEKI